MEIPAYETFLGSLGTNRLTEAQHQHFHQLLANVCVYPYRLKCYALRHRLGQGWETQFTVEGWSEMDSQASFMIPVPDSVDEIDQEMLNIAAIDIMRKLNVQDQLKEHGRLIDVPTMGDDR